MSGDPIIVDLDDFTGSAPDLVRLLSLKAQIPGFRVTLFTIPGRISQARVKEVRENYDWIDLVPHGLMHTDAHECEHWHHSAMRACLAHCNGWPYTRGFKAPGWLLSDACYEVLHEQGYWLADQVYNRARRPSGMGIYELDAPNKIHGHLGHLGGHNANELEVLIPHLLGLRDREFGFVRDHVEIWQPTTL